MPARQGSSWPLFKTGEKVLSHRFSVKKAVSAKRDGVPRNRPRNRPVSGGPPCSPRHSPSRPKMAKSPIFGRKWQNRPFSAKNGKIAHFRPERKKERQTPLNGEAGRGLRQTIEWLGRRGPRGRRRATDRGGRPRHGPATPARPRRAYKIRNFSSISTASRVPYLQQAMGRPLSPGPGEPMTALGPEPSTTGCDGPAGAAEPDGANNNSQ